MAAEDPTRLSAQVLIDMVAGWDPEAPDLYETAYETALPRLSEVGAVTATLDDETGELKLEMGPLINGAITSMLWLVKELAEVTSLSREEILFSLRESWS